MKLVAYREFRPHEELSPNAEKFYGRMGITESFLKDAEYAGPHEAAWAFLARRKVGCIFSKKLKAAFANYGMETEIEERSKRLKRIVDKLTRSNRSPGLEPSRLSKILESMNLPAPVYPIGSVRDMYGIRVILQSSVSSREDCYDALDIVLRVARITNAAQIMSLVDYLAYPEHRFAPGGTYLGRYESLQVSFPYLGVPIEVQIRDAAMDWNAKNLVKRDGLDR